MSLALAPLREAWASAPALDTRCLAPWLESGWEPAHLLLGLAFASLYRGLVVRWPGLSGARGGVLTVAPSWLVAVTLLGLAAPAPGLDGPGLLETLAWSLPVPLSFGLALGRSHDWFCAQVLQREEEWSRWALLGLTAGLLISVALAGLVLAAPGGPAWLTQAGSTPQDLLHRLAGVAGAAGCLFGLTAVLSSREDRMARLPA